MLIGFRLDLTDLASPPRGTASSLGEGFCMGVSREKGGEGGKKKGKRVKKGAGGRGRGCDGGGLEECGRYCQLACGRKKVLTGEVTQS